jgi:hypothetical protein
MAFVRTKKIAGHKYRYLVESEWKDGKCHQKVIKYLGRVVDKPPDA